MEWLTCIRAAIEFIERHLTDDITPQDVAQRVYMSPFFLQRGFSLMTGFGIGEYIRSRRLYNAALDLKRTKDRVIDVALRYCYETPESFAKAFTRFHGATPTQVREGAAARAFLPLTINITINGGSQMDCRIANMFPFKLIGFERVFENETAYEKIPAFWDEVFAKYANVFGGGAPADEYEKAIEDNCIGEYGVCIDDMGEGRFRYLIAGKYAGGEVPRGMSLYEFPQGEWAVFNCVGPLPVALQSMNTRIFSEWLPGNPDYELSCSASVEWYDCVNGSKDDPDYRSAIWLPVRKKYSAEVKEKWGDTKAYAEYEAKNKNRSKTARREAEEGLNNLFGRFAQCRARGCSPDSKEAQALVDELQAYITGNYYTCTDEILKGLGQMYTADERFRANIDRHGAGTAEFVSAAVESRSGR